MGDTNGKHKDARPRPVSKADPAIERMRESLTRPGAPLRPGQKPLPTKPKRVSGGLRLRRKEDQQPQSVPERRLQRLMELGAEASAIEEGLAYARQGQARSLLIEPGRVVALVQGRRQRAYEVTIEADPIAPERWDAVADLLNERPRIAADVLAGRLPADVEEVFAPAGTWLLPASPDALRVRSTSPDDPGPMPPGRWSKHVCCALALLAEKITDDPMAAFRLRGLDDGELADRMSHRRLATAGGLTPKPIYQPRVPGASDADHPPAGEAEGEDARAFWLAHADLEELDLSLEPPAVPTPMLRRLGPSPFEAARFPITGLLATCYELARRRLVGGPTDAGDDHDQTTTLPDDADTSQQATPRPAARTAEQRAEAIRAKLAGKARARKK